MKKNSHSLVSLCRALMALLVAGSHAVAADYYVSPSGSNVATGSVDAPWLTLNHAFAQVQPGDTVNVYGGSYNERLALALSGAADAYITLRAVEGETPIIDGAGLSVSGRQGLIELQSCSYVRIEGMTVRNFTTSMRDIVPVGILVEGSGAGIELVNNTVEHISSTATVRSNLLGRDAHGIGVYGTGNTAITELLIQGNTLRNLTLGSSEAMVLNGNVDEFRVINNAVSNCDNIGIDCIGFEGTGPTDLLDQARNGWISGNVVSNITTTSNPAYENEPSAGGIYVDGGRDIIIERNQVSMCDIGIEVASEHTGKSTSNIIVRSNLLRECLMAGLFIGGYDNSSTGSTDDCAILHNTFYNNDTRANGDEFGQLHIQYDVNNVLIAGNVFYHDISKSGGYNIFLVQWNTTGSGFTINRNLYYGPATPVWVIGDDWIEGWGDYQSLSVSGPQETWGNPNFVDAPTDDFKLQTGSPAINLGDPSQNIGPRDLDGYERVEGAAPDAGALELGAAWPASGDFGIGHDAEGISVAWSAESGWLGALQASRDLESWRLVPGHVAGAPDGADAVADSIVLDAGDSVRFFRIAYE